MTVAELVELLSALPGDARVVVDGHEGGFDDPHVWGAVVLLDQPLAYFFGEHEAWWPGEQAQGATAVVWLGREAPVPDCGTYPSYGQALRALEEADDAD